MGTIPWQHPCFEKFKACSPVHLPLDCFEPVNVSRSSFDAGAAGASGGEDSYQISFWKSSSAEYGVPSSIRVRSASIRARLADLKNNCISGPIRRPYFFFQNRMDMIRDLKWSSAEKFVARTAFEHALRQELKEIMTETRKMAANIEEVSDLWNLERWLTQRRLAIDRKIRLSLLDAADCVRHPAEGGPRPRKRSARPRPGEVRN